MKRKEKKWYDIKVCLINTSQFNRLNSMNWLLDQERIGELWLGRGWKEHEGRVDGFGDWLSGSWRFHEESDIDITLQN